MLRDDRLGGMAPSPIKKLRVTEESGLAPGPSRRRFGASRRSGVNRVLGPLVRTVRTTHPQADVKLIGRAYEVAAGCHANQ